MVEDIYKSKSGVPAPHLAEVLNAFYAEQFHLVQILPDPDRQELTIDGLVTRRPSGTFTVLVVRG